MNDVIRDILKDNTELLHRYEKSEARYIPQSQADICSTSDPDEWRKSYPQNLEVRFDKDSPIILRHRSIKHDPQA